MATLDPIILHRQAMKFCDRADAAQRAGDMEMVKQHLAYALRRECGAALATTQEPSRAILLISVAAIATQLAERILP